jgi:hypothetical protein
LPPTPLSALLHPHPDPEIPLTQPPAKENALWFKKDTMILAQFLNAGFSG